MTIYFSEWTWNGIKYLKSAATSSLREITWSEIFDLRFLIIKRQITFLATLSRYRGKALWIYEFVVFKNNTSQNQRARLSSTAFYDRVILF